MDEFRGKTVLVTGAAGNLGAAVAAAFGARGANLALADLRRDALARRFAAQDARRMLIEADLRRPADAARVAADAAARFGTLDVLCNVAGGFRMGEPIHETPDETWDFLFDLNARSVLNMARAVVPRMLAQGGGKIVNVAAYAALRGERNKGAYVASKSVVIRVTEAMAAELREHAVNVNCVLPSTLDTPENRAAMPDADPARWVDPADLAEVVVFLASRAARAIHGAAIPVVGLA